MRKIIVTFDFETERIKIKTEGFTGKECIEETKELEKELGKVLKEEKTAEYYKTQTQNQNKIRR